MSRALTLQTAALFLIPGTIYGPLTPTKIGPRALLGEVHPSAQIYLLGVLSGVTYCSKLRQSFEASFARLGIEGSRASMGFRDFLAGD